MRTVFKWMTWTALVAGEGAERKELKTMETLFNYLPTPKDVQSKHACRRLAARTQMDGARFARLPKRFHCIHFQTVTGPKVRAASADRPPSTYQCLKCSLILFLLWCFWCFVQLNKWKQRIKIKMCKTIRQVRKNLLIRPPTPGQVESMRWHAHSILTVLTVKSWIWNE